MKKFNLAVLSVVLLVSCSKHIAVSYDYDKDVNFIHYDSYNYTPEAVNIEMNQLMKKRFFNAISESMQENGFTWSEDPDLFVHFHVNLKKTEKKTRTEVKSLSESSTYDVGTGFTGSYNDHSDYQEGTLIIDLIDAKKNRLLWQGVARVDLAESSSNTDKEVRKIVRAVFKKYPPK